MFFRLFLLALLALSFFVQAEDFPVLYKGRVRPFSVYTKLWTEDVLNTQVSDSKDIMWKIYLGNNLNNDPLFKISSKIKKALDLEGDRFSFQQIQTALNNSPQIAKTLVESTFWQQYLTTGQEKQELKTLSDQLSVELKENELILTNVPDVGIWSTLKQGEVISEWSPEIESKMRKQKLFANDITNLLGRLQEYTTLKDNGFLALPLKKPNGAWGTLKLLETSAKNITKYTSFPKLKEDWKNNDRTTLEKDLYEAYGTIAGHAYEESGNKTLYYPSYLQLKVEAFLYIAPFIEIAMALYFIAFILFWKKNRMAFSIYIVGFCLHTLFLALRCYVLERPPVSNMFESVIYVPWIIVLTSLIFRNRFLFSASSLSASLLLFLLLLTNMGKSMENVQAVLDSQYWLIIHVLMVVGSYGLFILAGILGHFFLGYTLIKKRENPALAKLILQCMYAGVALLIPGTILGGIWAAESWGRFWDWDPKEAWAFISACVYLIWIHAYRFGLIKQFGLAIGSIVGLLAITFTWYGVNYILGTGLHSYGFGNGGEIYYYIFIILEISFLIFASLPKQLKKV